MGIPGRGWNVCKSMEAQDSSLLRSRHEVRKPTVSQKERNVSSAVNELEDVRPEALSIQRGTWEENKPLIVYLALAGVTQWLGRRPSHQKVVSSIPNQGTYLGLGSGPVLGVCKRQPINDLFSHRYFSPSLSPSLLSLKIKEIFLKDNMLVFYNVFPHT